MWIIPWDPFLMKKLLKSGICRSINSTQIYCLPWKSQQIWAEPKKKKRKPHNKNTNTIIIWIQTGTIYVFFFFLFLIDFLNEWREVGLGYFFVERLGYFFDRIVVVLMWRCLMDTCLFWESNGRKSSPSHSTCYNLW